jgi:hypothetical protein
MSLISGSYSRLLSVCGTELLRDAMVEKDDATAVRDVIGFEGAVRRAIGLIALVTMLDRDRRFREAVLHRLRLKADMLISVCRAGRRQCSCREKGQSYFALLRGLLVFEEVLGKR